MALQIEEYREPGRTAPVPLHPPLAIQAVAIGASSIQSVTLNASTRIVRLISDAECYYKVGQNPTAAAGSTSCRLPANTFLDIGVDTGVKIAVVQA
ncbi:hypothetical protein SH591_08710 [Sphingomonas sp. LY54]|uniref:hypothetical protein n=1 Tax=Sphingomonas sp. LY54 TaxID=3095343 RepID=UPI002D767F9D|nr:hypothetical protein [Sphingomonas sp. LY54]WRP27204.1 hypothetical protein SH591_08710 [Sphingomonas sp. LY54]